MNTDTTITVRGVDFEVWKKFQQSVLEMYGTLYGYLGPELTKALTLWLERPKPESHQINYEKYKSRSSMKQMIHDAIVHLGGEGTIQQVSSFVIDKYGSINPNSISTSMSDLSVNGPPTSPYPLEQRFLERVSRGRYRFSRMIRAGTEK